MASKALGQFRSRGSLRASLPAVAVVLASPGFPELASPFHPPGPQLFGQPVETGGWSAGRNWWLVRTWMLTI